MKDIILTIVIAYVILKLLHGMVNIMVIGFITGILVYFFRKYTHG